MLYKNVTLSPYFLKLCSAVDTYQKAVDEIYYKVDHVMPFTPGSARDPSSCFCVLTRLCALRVTPKQVRAMCCHLDSPYIRCVGFLYLRFTVDPKDIWEVRNRDGDV